MLKSLWDLSTGILAHFSLVKLSDNWWSLVFILLLLSLHSTKHFEDWTGPSGILYEPGFRRFIRILWDDCPAGKSSDRQLQFMEQRHHILQRIHYVLPITPPAHTSCLFYSGHCPTADPWVPHSHGSKKYFSKNYSPSQYNKTFPILNTQEAFATSHHIITKLNYTVRIPLIRTAWQNCVANISQPNWKNVFDTHKQMCINQCVCLSVQTESVTNTNLRKTILWNVCSEISIICIVL